MNCLLAKINGTTTPCEEEGCAGWDKQHSQCIIATYCQAYFSMGLATLKLHNLMERLEKEDEEKEE